MYNKGKILIGILIFLVLFTSPFWYSMAIGKADYYPDPEIATEGLPGLDRCVKDTEYMRASHMDLLNTWRNDVVREADRIYTDEYGRDYRKSLTKTCMKCHYNKVQFCDKCHDYMAVGQPDCWECHIAPEPQEEVGI